MSRTKLLLAPDLRQWTWQFAAFDLLHKINSFRFVIEHVLQLVVCGSTWSGCCEDHSGLSDNYDTMTTVKA